MLFLLLLSRDVKKDAIVPATFNEAATGSGDHSPLPMDGGESRFVTVGGPVDGPRGSGWTIGSRLTVSGCGGHGPRENSILHRPPALAREDGVVSQSWNHRRAIPARRT
jgi:hypothetical protein